MINQANNRLHRMAVPPLVSRDVQRSASHTAPLEFWQRGSSHGTPLVPWAIGRNEPGTCPRHKRHAVATTRKLSQQFRHSNGGRDFLSKLFRNASLLQNCIRRVARPNVMVHRETPVGNWSVPDFVIAPAHAFKAALMGSQDLFEPERVTSHQEAAATTLLS